MPERLDYKECRENVFKLIEKSNVLSKQEIWDIIGLGDNMDYIYDYWRFPAFLKHTRRYAFREYCKSKNERIITSNIIFLREILNRGEGSIYEFIQFCEIERIPLLYYVSQIKKYVFPNKQLLQPIYNRLHIIGIKGFITSIKRTERVGMYHNIDEIIAVLSQAFKKSDIKEEEEASQYIFAFLKENYIFGEEKEQMFKRLKFDEQLKKSNEEIEKNLYSIVDLELWKE